MPAQIDHPSNVGSDNVWGLQGAPNMMAALASNDGSSSFIYVDSGGAIRRAMFYFPTIAGVADPVNSAGLGLYARQQAPGIGGQTLYAVWNSASIVQNLWMYVPDNGSYGAAAPNATDLSLAAVNGQHGLQFSAAGGPSNKAEVWVTEFWRAVTFNYAGGSSGDFGYLIGSLVGALIGSNLLLRDMPGVSRAMARVWRGGRNVRLLAHELEPAWRAWRAFRHPVFSR